MNKMIITVLGKDRPGIISHISNLLYELECNLENVNQMILQNQFAGFFIIEPPSGVDETLLRKRLDEKNGTSGLTIHINTLGNDLETGNDPGGDIFLITTIGPDQKGLVARISKIIAGFNANIINLKAVFKGGLDPRANVMSYQVQITPDVDAGAMFDALKQKAAELDLDIRIQHRNIFDVINKI
ncbi:glycine cleavage system protein R [Desulfospira joergensenii]|uniref:glycine cleavage system protein R n=1 Tax=Desulfospira joergensenii TaxID=53329 RepID=UPI0003B6B75A|nr:ACT domain-containing protein [Desulfospira joergensenii]